MAERCVCSHDYWDHEDVPITAFDEDGAQMKCAGDFGMCECEEFTYLGEEEENG